MNTQKDTQRALSKYAYYESIESGRIVMKKGDRPLRFHIIITGRALLADIYKLPDGKEKILWRGKGLRIYSLVLSNSLF